MELLEKKGVILSLHYLPSIEYFAFLSQSPEVLIDICEHYDKQSYRNRCQILTANKVLDLSVPILKTNKKQAMKDVCIDYSHKWVKDHWRAICSAYGKAPFFEYYIDYLERSFAKTHKYLIDLNAELLTICLDILGMSKKYQLSESYLEEGNSYIDLRNQLHPKKNNDFDRRFDIPSYNQVFGKGFVANLSIIDILFCEGPNTYSLINRAKAKSFATSFE